MNGLTMELHVEFMLSYARRSQQRVHVPVTLTCFFVRGPAEPDVQASFSVSNS